MEHSADVFTGKGGLQLYCQQWIPEGEPKASLLVVHGVGEHSGRYTNLVEYLVPRGYAIFGHDHRGHGKSPGDRIYIDRWDDYRQDLRAQVQRVLKIAPHQPLFIFGHSMGGLMTLDFALHYPAGIAGVIVSGAALDSGGASAGLKLAAKILSRFAPRYYLQSPIAPEQLSRDPAVGEAYVADPLVFIGNTPRWGVEMIKTIEWVQAHVSDWTLPLLMTHGEADQIVSIAGSRRFYDKLNCPDKAFISYPAGRHESHNELNYLEVLADIENWLSGRISSEN